MGLFDYESTKADRRTSLLGRKSEAEASLSGKHRARQEARAHTDQSALFGLFRKEKGAQGPARAVLLVLAGRDRVGEANARGTGQRQADSKDHVAAPGDKARAKEREASSTDH